MVELLCGIWLFLLLDKAPAVFFSCHNQADGTNSCLSAVAVPAEATKGLHPVDKPRCDFIQGLSGSVKTEVLMEIQSCFAASGIQSR